MTVVPLAHSAHWLVNAAYVLPFLGLLVWLFVTTIRERRHTEQEPAEADDSPSPEASS